MCTDTSKPRTSAPAAVTHSPSLSQSQSSQLLSLQQILWHWSLFLHMAEDEAAPLPSRGLAPPGSSGTIVLLLPAFCRTLEIPLKSNNSNSEDTKEKAISFKLHSAPWVLLTVTGTCLLLPFLQSEVHLSQEKCPKGSGRHLK